MRDFQRSEIIGMVQNRLEAGDFVKLDLGLFTIYDDDDDDGLKINYKLL